MIPEIIHYCWISDDQYPPLINMCINKCHNFHPLYKFKKWGLKELLSIENLPKWVYKALEAKKYAFVADYIRHYAIYNYGGWYCDSDIMFLKPISNKFRKYDFVSTVEETMDYYGGKIFINKICYGIGIEAAMFGGVKYNKICNEVLRYYNDEYEHIFDSSKINDKFFPLAPQVLGYCCNKFGFDYNNPVGIFDDNCYISEDLALSIIKYHQYKDIHNKYPQNTIALHMCTGTWRNINIKGVQK